jgi:chromosome segregation protein
LNDLREEVEKQIRHLQRQAATARRYQTLKEEERKLLAELLALRLQALDLEAQVRDAAMAGCDTAMHAQVADLRELEAHIERLRADQAGKADALSLIQARFYEAGAEVARTEQNIEHARQMRQRQQSDLEQVQAQGADLGSVMQRDRSQLDSLAQELAVMAPDLDAAHALELTAATGLAGCEQVLTEWQVTWDAHAKSVAVAQRETQVERARIEQLDSQQRRLLQQQERLTAERGALAELQPGLATEALAQRMAAAQDAGMRASEELQELLAELSAAREAEREQTQALNGLRSRLQEAQGKLVSTEALQQAALGKASGKVAEWLKSKSLHLQPRVAQQLRVEKGWERAVETVLGSYLEAVCVEGLESITSLLPSFESGQLAVVSTLDGASAQAGAGSDSLLSKIQGTALLASVLAPVRTAESLQEALRIQPRLAGGESVVTRDGIWLGAEWLRVSRDADAHAGVIEREEVLREVRTRVAALAEELRQFEVRLDSTRTRVHDHEDRRDRLQAEVNRLHREHVDRKAEHDAAQSRRADAERRLAQLQTELGDVASDLATSEADLHASRGRMETAIDALAALEPQRVELEQSRERMRTDLAAARTAASTAQQQARELALQVESRRSSHSALTTTISRIELQLESLKARQQEVADQLARGEAPLIAAQAQLEQCLQLRAAVEAELQAARIASDELESQLRERDSLRAEAEQRVEAARSALDEARLATQQVRVRRESVAEQLAATSFEFDALRAQLPEAAAVEGWEAQLEETRAKIERLGQVNLAAIGEFKEQSERKEYLDRQCKDLTDALETLESAMRKIDRETRARFQETFDRVNAGLKEKFPRLFGGGHAYLELTGEESSVAGVSVMARPPGKRNSTISQLSGGEKALTAVALVFSIFDLNPAPFCLLDEVDAPLDENNVGRFCDIVREMSRNVQFIFITHNKTTMELASQLVGVTMNEPGVSRLVAVDVDEAVRMAAM